MGQKQIFGGLILLLLFSISFSSAITGSIGNARMILRTSAGETIEKSILVKNVNDVAVDIELFATGDLEDDIDIIDDSFRLEPGSEKKAYFEIHVNEAGTTETAINVKFSPVEGGNGVGLMSTIIVIAEESEGWSFWKKDDTQDSDDKEEDNNSTGDDNDASEAAFSLGGLVIFLLALFVVLLIMVVLILLRSKSKKDVHRK